MMDMDGSSSSSNPGPHQPALRSRRSKALYQFKQQRLPVCKPVLTPVSVMATFLVMGFVFIPVGLITLHGSRNAVEIVDRYDAECVPEEFRGNKLSYITDKTVSKNCTRYLKVQKHMKAPIYIYYQLDNYYQNHRRYVKSRSDQQLLHGLKYSRTSSCEPEEFDNGLPIVPCGLIAWSLFNDTFTFFRERTKVRVSRKNIAWKSDRDHKFGKNVYPYNFQNGTLVGGSELDPRIPLSEEEDLIVWMRTAALPSFRKLYGRIEEDLEQGDVVVVNLMNNYNTYSFGGMKKLVLSTSSWLGGRNDFLGIAYLVVGSSSIIISIIFMLLHMKNPRPYGDNSWNKKSISG
ncbi:PREDICTED: putative ALA-interacting subunit 2 isoform X2 [Tarenaya hassleriana]|uniref:putative ALA-interacting subunit 2 isoform X2 n=1 Tax=Tarenaya hassleriana TaxID=28532 RepID=UPI00053C2B00|nr:PREDICTED: putative ALA-interacting subunit 2 isoform X2 [Tarenaya hassleriana]XP_010538552.1 PREDICTED: putative ALA-interacting subunit 2 isoform X2 [Tarenaya hassleriana]XP_010538553.1 PREDICTED: putative ALA-interacting subunit 2 isoform X2 [Tarenaya hassleriana]